MCPSNAAPIPWPRRDSSTDKPISPALSVPRKSSLAPTGCPFTYAINARVRPDGSATSARRRARACARSGVVIAPIDGCGVVENSFTSRIRMASCGGAAVVGIGSERVRTIAGKCFRHRKRLTRRNRASCARRARGEPPTSRRDRCEPRRRERRLPQQTIRPYSARRAARAPRDHGSTLRLRRSHLAAWAITLARSKTQRAGHRARPFVCRTAGLKACTTPNAQKLSRSAN